MDSIKNRFEYLRKPGRQTTYIPRNPQTTVLITNGPDAITVTTAEFEPQQYGFGYMLCLASGRNPYSLCSLNHGVFSSRLDAQLYFLGYCLTKSEAFQPEALEAIRRKIAELQQGSLDF